MVTRAGAELALYVDGIKQNSRSDVAAQNATANGTAYIGVTSATNSYPFSGQIDDVRIYNRALTTGEVQKLYIITNKVQGGECNDANAAIHPLATEVCDLVDNDCDGSLDEGVQTTYYQDADGDLYGNSAATTGACSVPTGWT